MNQKEGKWYIYYTVSHTHTHTHTHTRHMSKRQVKMIKIFFILINSLNMKKTC